MKAFLGNLNLISSRFVPEELPLPHHISPHHTSPRLTDRELVDPFGIARGFAGGGPGGIYSGDLTTSNTHEGFSGSFGKPPGVSATSGASSHPTDWGLDDFEPLLPNTSFYTAPARRNSSRTSVSTRSELYIQRPVQSFGPASSLSVSHAPHALSDPPPNAHPLTSPVVACWTRATRLMLLTQRTTGELFEKLKYDLIVSNLLDDTITHQPCPSSIRLKPLHRTMFATLRPRNQTYDVRFRFWFPVLVLLRLLRVAQRCLRPASSMAPRHLRVAALVVASVVAAVCMLYFKQRYVQSMVLRASVLRSLGEFLRENYRLNGLVRGIHREYQFWGLLTHPLYPSAGVATIPSLHTAAKGLAQGVEPAAIPKGPAESLVALVTLLITRFHAHIARLLPHLNGDILKRYCEIYNLEGMEETLLNKPSAFSPRAFSKTAEVVGAAPTMEGETARFNRVRKFLICQLLALNEPPQYTFFLLKLWAIYGVEAEVALKGEEKVELIRAILRAAGEDIRVYGGVLRDLKRSIAGPGEQDSSTSVEEGGLVHSLGDISVDGGHGAPQLAPITTALDRLALGVQHLSVNLGHLRTYNLDDKLQVLESLGTDLSLAMDHYHRSVKELQVQAPPSSPTGLRVFGTSRANMKKRFSLPPKAKRLSGGLPVNLLTVFEEGEGRRVISYDDNYLNITPTPRVAVEKSPTPSPEDGAEGIVLIEEGAMVGITSAVGEETVNSNSPPSPSSSSLSPLELKAQLTHTFERFLDPPKRNRQTAIFGTPVGHLVAKEEGGLEEGVLEGPEGVCAEVALAPPFGDERTKVLAQTQRELAGGAEQPDFLLELARVMDSSRSVA